MKRLTETSVLNIKNKSFQITAAHRARGAGRKGRSSPRRSLRRLGIDDARGRGAVCLQPRRRRGVRDRRRGPLPAGEHQVRAEVAYDGGLAKGGTVTLYYDGEQTGQGTLAATAPIGFSPNETAGIGHEIGTTVLPGTAPADTVFNGKISG